MTFGNTRVSLLVLAAVLLTVVTGNAHHAKSAKFDDTKRTELRGIVTYVDWRNPHVHVFTNVARENGELENWAVELESTVLLKRSGWQSDSLRPLLLDHVPVIDRFGSSRFSSLPSMT